MAKKDSYILVNMSSNFTFDKAKKLNGTEGNKFVKGEHFEIDKKIERVVKRDSNNKPVIESIDGFELMNKLFPGQIKEVKDVVSKNSVAEMEKRIEELEAQNESLKYKGKNTVKDSPIEYEKQEGK